MSNELLEPEIGNVTVSVTAVQKKTHDGLRRVKVAAFKPAEERIPEDGDVSKTKYYCCVVTEASNFRRIQTSYAIWKRLLGFRNTLDRKPATKGWEFLKDDHNIYLGLRKIEGALPPKAGTDNFSNMEVVKIDLIPNKDLSHNMKPVLDLDVVDVTARMWPEDGSFEVLRYPIGVNERDINQLLINLDKIGSLYNGLDLPGQWRIREVRGRDVTFEVPPGLVAS